MRIMHASCGGNQFATGIGDDVYACTNALLLGISNGHLLVDFK
jgi:hypothetical protein